MLGSYHFLLDQTYIGLLDLSLILQKVHRKKFLHFALIYRMCINSMGHFLDDRHFKTTLPTFMFIKSRPGLKVFIPRLYIFLVLALCHLLQKLFSPSLLALYF